MESGQQDLVDQTVVASRIILAGQSNLCRWATVCDAPEVDLAPRSFELSFHPHVFAPQPPSYELIRFLGELGDEQVLKRTIGDHLLGLWKQSQIPQAISVAQQAQQGRAANLRENVGPQVADGN